MSLLNLVILGHNLLPLDTPEVASAKLQHYRDFAVAAERNGVHVPLVSAPLLAGPYPVDTPEVFFGVFSRNNHNLGATGAVS